MRLRYVLAALGVLVLILAAVANWYTNGVETRRYCHDHALIGNSYFYAAHLTAPRTQLESEQLYEAAYNRCLHTTERTFYLRAFAF